ncbi:hypothetical protein HPP92_015088 [Vanilla planifolia]|uniref:Senescence regulator n=1 Tax=Vanilla planifolia TaxID=51239 RepID=A0A835UVG8_VANPL|nr:hypothetical protein HPP92_015088 [Vanilla planifolia]
MAKEGSTVVSLPASPFQTSYSPFSSIRFLCVANNPNSTPATGNHYELEEGDVFWPSDLDSDQSSDRSFSPTFNIRAVGGDSSLPSSPSIRRHRSSLPERFGLSSILAEDGGPLHESVNVPMDRTVPAKVEKVFHQSAPVNVTAWPRGRQQLARASLFDVEERAEEDDAEEEMLPPHLIVARSQEMTFSVFEGVGRTLKGRDLRRVRNAVFQRTGFLD